MRWVAVKMDRQDCFRPSCDDLFDTCWVKVKGGVFNVGIHRFCSNIRNGPTGGDESKRSGDDLIPRLQVEQQQGHMQGRCAAVKSDAMLSAAEAGEIRFKLRYVRTKTEGTTIKRSRNSHINLLAQTAHLRSQI